MRVTKWVIAICGLVVLCAPVFGQRVTDTASLDPIKALAERLELERYKAVIKGLTQFGDRRQGTDRNRAAVNWIEAQLRSYGCADVARLKYDYQPPPANPGGRGRGNTRLGQGG